ncbi:DUF4240 domain-containing protein [Flavobacterium algicola]|uniref:DUF4240 domain-containing protein n=1 Tax=Flavobacterium algicola TaxID=556529 RepID=UPI001EFC3A74|nr:DUF4240 domain-containing protein [Flavobacterium algicola]MCG9792750.1 DUF4240 domain-containing protein [Flavobacterium algicola]
MKKATTFLLVFLSYGAACSAQNSVISNEKETKTTPVNEVLASVVFDSIHFEKSAEMLNEDQYWSIIDKANQANLGQADKEIFITNEVQKLTPKEIIGFRLRTDKLLFDSYKSHLWCAAYIMNSGTDGGFDYFRCWIISKGKDVYYKAVENPDSLISEVNLAKDSYEFEGFWFVAMNAFLNKTDHEIYDYMDYETFVTNDEHYPLIAFDWNVDEPKTMQKVCPQLFGKLWKN